MKNELIAVFIGALLVLLSVQYRAGAWEREFGLHPDEPAHYVTGVMVAEYLRQGAPVNPLHFAEQYYIRYPRLAIGHWPPLFSGLLGSWILVFGPERFSVFFLMALLGAGAAALLYLLIRDHNAVWLGAAGVAWWTLSHWQTQVWISTVMTEIPLALFCLAAVLAYVWYLEAPGPFPALLFGLAASAALLTKGLGAALAVVPLLAAAACGRWALLRRWDFWMPAGIVALLAGPWYLLQGSLIPSAFGGVMKRLTIARLTDDFERASFVLGLLGPVAGVAAGAALLALFLAPALRGRCSPRVAVIGAYAVGCLALHAALPESAEPRHLFHLAPIGIAAVLLVVGAAAGRAPAWALWSAKAALVAAVLFRLAWPGGWPEKPDFALVALAEEVAADPSLDGAVFLVASHGTAKGAWIAETARLAPDPRWFVLRATKSLVWIDWRAESRYDAYFETASSMEEFLETYPVALIVMERGQLKELPYEALLREMVETQPGKWRLAAERVSSNRDFHVVAYRSTRADLLPRGPVRLNMGPRLGYTLESSPDPSMRSIGPQ